MKLTPHSARLYLTLAVLLLAIPAINKTVYPSKAGYLLVAPAGSRAPWDDVVIYIVHHDLFSAGGIIINKPKTDAPLIGGQVPYYGGPVSTTSRLEYYDVTGTNLPYLGYVGWGPVQLDYELYRGSWHLVKAEAAILDTPPQSMWGKAMEKVPVNPGKAML